MTTSSSDESTAPASRSRPWACASNSGDRRPRSNWVRSGDGIGCPHPRPAWHWVRTSAATSAVVSESCSASPASGAVALEVNRSAWRCVVGFRWGHKTHGQLTQLGYRDVHDVQEVAILKFDEPVLDVHEQAGDPVQEDPIRQVDPNCWRLIHVRRSLDARRHDGYRPIRRYLAVRPLHVPAAPPLGRSTATSPCRGEHPGGQRNRHQLRL